MKSITKLISSAVAVTSLALVATGCGSPSSSASTDKDGVTTLRVGITGATAPPTFLVLTADKLGFAAKHNLKIKYVTLSPNVTAQTLAKGSVDFVAAPSVETAMLTGAPFKIVAGAAKSYWDFYAEKKIGDWKDLKGKRVGLPCGQAATCHSFMIDVLASHDVSADSVTFIYGTAQSNYSSLDAGSVDAALTTAPYTYALDKAGKTSRFELTGTSPYLSTQITATESFINKNKKVVSEFVSAIKEAQAKLSTSPDDPKVLTEIETFEKANGIDPATLDQERFLTDFAKNKTWQIVPTREMIEQDLKLLAAIPELKDSAEGKSFDDLVYQLPEFEGQYE
jgi:ABC-type nitrate/sulfonate/bicarbonate transport system substrate-binding protein